MIGKEEMSEAEVERRCEVLRKKREGLRNVEIIERCALAATG